VEGKAVSGKLSLLEAIDTEANKSEHNAAGWHLRVVFISGEEIGLPVTEIGLGYAKLELPSGDGGPSGEFLFVHEASIKWAWIDWDAVTIAPKRVRTGPAGRWPALRADPAERPDR
jgi:hypothetical protein